MSRGTEARFRYAVRTPMDHETPFLIALGTLVVAALVVGVSGWVLFFRDRGLAHARTTVDAHHREADGDR